jgi:uncharacterized protein (TIGR02246 family)
MAFVADSEDHHAVSMLQHDVVFATHPRGVPMKARAMRAIAIVILFLAGLTAAAQSKSDEDAIRSILDNEVTTWNQGDADGYSRHFAADGTFTNVRGMFYTGQRAYRDRHEVIFKGPFLGTRLQLQVVSLRFLTPDVAICETLSWVSDFKSGAPPNLYLDTKGRLRTRLLQVMTKRNGEWQIEVYHNVDIKPDVNTPEPN